MIVVLVRFDQPRAVLDEEPAILLFVNCGHKVPTSISSYSAREQMLEEEPLTDVIHTADESEMLKRRYPSFSMQQFRRAGGGALPIPTSAWDAWISFDLLAMRTADS